MIERRNGMISSIMVKYINTDGNTVEWDSHVDEATRQRNFHQLGYLGFTPFQIRQPRRRLPLPVLPNQSDIGLFYQRNQPGRMGDQRRHKVTLNDVSRNEEVGKWALRLILS
jgi:hypothetical protein